MYATNDVDNWQDITKYTLLQSYDFENELKNDDTHTYQIYNTNSYKIYALEVTDTAWDNDRVMIGYFKINCYFKQPTTEYDWYVMVQNIHLYKTLTCGITTI